MQKDISEKAKSVLSFYEGLKKDINNHYHDHSPYNLTFKSDKTNFHSSSCLYGFKKLFNTFYNKETIRELNKVYFGVNVANPDTENILKFWGNCVQSGFLPSDFLNTLKIKDGHFSFELTIHEQMTMFELFVYICNFRCVNEIKTIHKLVNFMTDLGYDFTYSLLAVNHETNKGYGHSWIFKGGLPTVPFSFSDVIIKELSPFTKNLTKELFGNYGSTVHGFILGESTNLNIYNCCFKLCDEITTKYNNKNIKTKFINLHTPESFSEFKGKREQLVA